MACIANHALLLLLLLTFLRAVSFAGGERWQGAAPYFFAHGVAASLKWLGAADLPTVRRYSLIFTKRINKAFLGHLLKGNMGQNKGLMPQN